MGIDKVVLDSHLNNGNFLDGVSRKKWRVIKQEWPFVWIAIRALPENGVPDEYVFRFECNNYPQVAPTAVPWDLEQNAPLAHELWPAGTGPVSTTFRPEWNPNALYVPMDRAGLQAHQEWAMQFPETSWNPRKEITHYVGLIYDYLNSPYYQGNRRSIGSRCQCPSCVAQAGR